MAVTYSKLPRSVTREEFDAILSKNPTCCEVMHAYSDSCLKGCYVMTSRAVLGSAKFFIPIYLAQIAVHGRNIDRRVLKKAAWGYFRSIVFGTGMAAGFMGSTCSLHRLLGGFHYYTSVMIPGAVGGLSVVLDDPNRRAIFVNTYFNMALEYLVTAYRLRLSRLKETSVFMLVSAILMYQLRTATNRSKMFWFYVPPRKVIQVLGECCPHTGPCWMDILKGGVKYAALAVAWQMAKIFLRLGLSVVKQYKKAKRMLFSKSTVKLSLSLGGYVLIYKAVSCFLCRKFGEDRPIFAAIAGLLAGSAYAIQPRIDIACSAIIALLTLLKRRSSILESGILKKIRATDFLLALTNGLFFQARVIDASNCPTFITAMMDTATQGMASEIYNKFIQLYAEAAADGKIKGVSQEDLVQKEGDTVRDPSYED